MTPVVLWNPIYKREVKVGDLSNCVFSIRMKHPGFVLIATGCGLEDRVWALVGREMENGVLTELPFSEGHGG